MNFAEIVKVNMRLPAHGRGLPARMALCIMLFHSGGKAGGPVAPVPAPRGRTEEAPTPRAVHRFSYIFHCHLKMVML